MKDEEKNALDKMIDECADQYVERKAQYEGEKGERTMVGSNMSFSQMLSSLAADPSRVAKRAIWGEDTCIYYVPGHTVAEKDWTGPKIPGEKIIRPHVDMLFGNMVYVGWISPREDISTEDWEVYECR